MLKQFGVKDIKVREVVSLDDEMLAFLPSVTRSYDCLLLLSNPD